MKDKKKTKKENKEQKIVTYMIDINPSMSIIILNKNGLYVPIQRQNCQSR